MARDDERTGRDSMRNPEQRDSQLASTHEDASLTDQVMGDTPNPEVWRDWKRRHRSHREDERR